MKKIFILSLVLFVFHSYSQVGIGTVIPSATLDIAAANPVGLTPNVDGILIPRVTRERAKSMLAVPTSTIIYVNEVVTGTATGTAINITAIGFYYYDGTVWRNLSGSGIADHDWYKFGTTTAPMAITDDMFHIGNVSIGKNTASISKLDISESLTANNTVVNVTHTIPAITPLETSLLNTTTNFTGTPTLASPTVLIGLKNTMAGTGETASGVVNTHNRYGVFNDFPNQTVGGHNYGMSNAFQTTNGAGTNGTRTGVANSFPGEGGSYCYGMNNNFINPNVLLGSGGGLYYGVRNNFDTSWSSCTGMLNVFPNKIAGTSITRRYGAQNIFGNSIGDNAGVHSTFTNTFATGNSYGTYADIRPTAGTARFYGNYVDANGTVGATQEIIGIYSRVPGGSNATGSLRHAARFYGPVTVGMTAGTEYYLPLQKGSKATGGQIPISTAVNFNKETIWSPFSFENTAATTIIGKYYGSFTSATTWNNNTKRVYTITDADCRTNSSISVSLTSGTLATADDFVIESVSTANGQFFVTVANVSGANIAGGYVIPFAFTAFY